MQKITPNLWFDKEAKEAAEFYVGMLPDSKIISIQTLHDTPSGDTDIISFKLLNYSFMAISAGPIFKLNPSVSFMLNFDPSENNKGLNIDTVWEKLIDGGKVLMPLDKYPFSDRYGWVQDKFGLSWQLILTKPEGEKRPLILPFLMFVGNVYGKAKEASEYYLSIFNNSKRGLITYYPAGMEPDKEGNVMFTDFKLENQWFAAMDSGHKHDFAFNESVSFIVNCDSQKEIDYYWERLSAFPESEQCGWLKDKFGVSWQIVPNQMNEMMEKGTREQIDRVTQAFLPMKKLDIQKLKEAYGGK